MFPDKPVAKPCHLMPCSAEPHHVDAIFNSILLTINSSTRTYHGYWSAIRLIRLVLFFAYVATHPYIPWSEQIPQDSAQLIFPTKSTLVQLMHSCPESTSESIGIPSSGFEQVRQVLHHAVW